MLIQASEICRQTRADMDGFIRRSRAVYCDQITAVAQALRDHCADTPVILLAGPSGSGKTTSALLLARQLTQWGYTTHTLSMDNYFAPLTPHEIELMHQHKIDLESPNRVDATFLNEQLRDILEGKEIRLPRYDFVSSDRVFDGNTLQRKPGELVIMEGIHALNPAVTGESSQFTARIYVSVRTRVQTQDGTLLHPSNIRLARRMLRDYIFRNRAMVDTVKMAPSVDAGEDKYIMPFKDRAAYHINTFIPYELSIYKNDLYEPLSQLQAQFPSLRPLMKVFDALDAIPTEHVPEDSLIREFIGGSIFAY